MMSRGLFGALDEHSLHIYIYIYKDCKLTYFIVTTVVGTILNLT